MFELKQFTQCSHQLNYYVLQYEQFIPYSILSKNVCSVIIISLVSPLVSKSLELEARYLEITSCDIWPTHPKCFNPKAWEIGISKAQLCQAIEDKPQNYRETLKDILTVLGIKSVNRQESLNMSCLLDPF